MVGGTGDDTYVVDDLGDETDESSTGGIDTVLSTISLTLQSYVENLVLLGTGDLHGTGNSSDNTLTGNSGNNLLKGGSGADTLYGGGGDDTLDGGSGSDVMEGGAGNDSYFVDRSSDVVVEALAGGVDHVQSTVSHTLAENVENLTLAGTSGLSGTGNALGNVLTGNNGSNALSGLDGDDTLIGGGGTDTLTGGAGADSFVFRNLTGGTDTITDFNGLDGGADEGDVLRFEGLLTGTFAYLGEDAFTAGGNTEARVSGSKVFVDTDGNGTADITITLTGLTAANQLNAADFVFV
jgi:Ca2+-binding RTX toxin-like protein